jgi:hypothetical protein
MFEEYPDGTLILLKHSNMLSFSSSYLIFDGEKPTMTPIYNLFAVSQVYTIASSKQCVQALYPLFVFPDRLLRVGQSLMVMNKKARRLKFSCRNSSHIRTPSSCHSNNSSSTNGLRYTSMSFPGCFGTGISISIMMTFRFMQSHGRRLYIHRVTGQVLWLLLISPKGFMPSVLKASLMFLASSAKSG